MSEAAASPASIRVAVVYVGARDQVIRYLEVYSGTLLGAAIDRSGILGLCPEIDLATCKVGIYGRLAALDRPLEDGDRVEIYRPLIADPKEMRKRRTERG